MKQLLHIELLDDEHVSVEFDIKDEDAMLMVATCISDLMFHNERFAAWVIGSFNALLTDEKAREILRNSTMVISNKNFN